VDKQQWFQILELRYGKISGTSCLLSFLTEYTDSNMRLQYHVDIIRSVTNGHGDLARESFPDHIDNISLLLW
jgi:hypothetical protein